MLYFIFFRHSVAPFERWSKFSMISDHIEFESRIFQIKFFRAGNSNIAITMVYKAKGLYSMYSHHELRSGIYSKESRAAGAKASREVLFLSGHN